MSSGFNLVLLLNQTWVLSPTHSKVNLLSLGYSEGKCSIYCRYQARSPGQLVLKKPKLPEDFQGNVFKDMVRERDCGVCDQLVDILLIGWWWGNRESTSSTFWFQPVWSLRACGQHTVKFFHLLEVSVSAKQLKGFGSENYLSPWGGTKGPWLCLMAKLLLFCLAWLFSFLSAFSHFSD